MDELLLAIVVNRTEQGPVAELLAQRGHGGVEALRVDLAEPVHAELVGDGVHLVGDGRVLVGEPAVIAADVDEADGVPGALEVEVETGDHGILGVEEAHVGDAADGHGHLVHETAGLAKVALLGNLPHARERGRVHSRTLPEGLHDTADRELERRRRREASAGGNVARHDEVEALRGATGCRQLGGHPAHEPLGRDLLVRSGLELVERHRDGVEALAREPHLVRSVRRGDTEDGTVEGARDDVATLVVGMVACDLGAGGRLHAHEPATVRSVARIEGCEKPLKPATLDVTHCPLPFNMVFDSFDVPGMGPTALVPNTSLHNLQEPFRLLRPLQVVRSG